MKTFAIGIDLGATSIKSGVVDKQGKLLDHHTIESKANKGPTSVLQQINFAIQELFSRHRPAECFGIGVGSPGIVSVEDQTVRHPPNFADWGEVMLAKAIRKTFEMPVFIDNDANVAAIAEARHGAGRQYNDFVFVTWGSGVGGGIILNKKIYHGPQGGAGEIGHITIDYNGPVCNCGSKGCIESYIGQRYLSERTRNILENMPKDHQPSKIEELVDGNLHRIDPYIIAQAAEQGDATARIILEEAGELLGYALASVMNILDLRVAVVGGGISAAPQFVFKAIENGIRSRVLQTHRISIRVHRAELGNTAGMIGAASLVI